MHTYRELLQGTCFLRVWQDMLFVACEMAAPAERCSQSYGPQRVCTLVVAVEVLKEGLKTPLGDLVGLERLLKGPVSKGLR